MTGGSGRSGGQQQHFIIIILIIIIILPILTLSFPQEHHSEHRLFLRIPCSSPAGRVLPRPPGEEEEEPGRGLGESQGGQPGGMGRDSQEEKVDYTI